MQTNLQPGQRVLVEAEVIRLKPARDGYADVKIYDHYYYAEDGSELEDAENLRLPAHHVHPLPAGGGWRPIESAPKDGTQIILGYNYEGYLFNCSDGRWTDHNGGGWVRSCMFQPTCWMPLTLPSLPSPPQAEGGAA